VTGRAGPDGGVVADDPGEAGDSEEAAGERDDSEEAAGERDDSEEARKRPRGREMTRKRPRGKRPPKAAPSSSPPSGEGLVEMVRVRVLTASRAVMARSSGAAAVL
jgi:hypothetical protein